MPTIYKCDNPSVRHRGRRIVVERKHIKDAYVALRKNEPIYEGTTETYTVVSGDTLSKIAKKKNTTVAKLKSDNGLTSDLIQVGQELTLSTATKKGDKVSFEKVKDIKVGDEVYIIAETENAADLPIEFNLKQGVEKGIVEVNETITVQQDGNDVGIIKSTVGAYFKEEDVENKDDFKNWAIAKITVKPLDKEKQKVWSEALDGLPDKKSKFYLLVDAHSNSEKDYLITYYGRNPDDEGKPYYKTCPNRWLDMDGKWLELELKDCCSQDMTKEQLKEIAVHASEANLEKYIDGFNETFGMFEINTCLRRVHFLAQVTHESGSFTYNEEQGNASYIAAYNGWHGRGLIQLTTEANYIAFGLAIGEDVTSTAENRDKLKESPYATHSAGWYWKDQSNLNVLADENDFIMITRKVNGGFNGYDDRLKYIKKGFKELIDKCSKNIDEDYDYKFSESKAYNDKRASFAWGLWHDSDINKLGCTYDKEKALEGYERFIELTDEEYSKTNWYKIKDIDAFADIKYSVVKNGVTKYYVKVRAAAELRIAALNS